MKIFNLFKKENRAGLENPQVPVTAAALVSSSGGSTGSVYGSLNETTALGVSAVFAAVRVIAESIATVERGVYEIDSAGNKIAAREKSEFDLLTRNPNPYMSATTFYELAMYSLLLRGNFFCHIQRNIAGS